MYCKGDSRGGLRVFYGCGGEYFISSSLCRNGNGLLPTDALFPLEASVGRLLMRKWVPMPSDFTYLLAHDGAVFRSRWCILNPLHRFSLFHDRRSNDSFSHCQNSALFLAISNRGNDLRQYLLVFAQITLNRGNKEGVITASMVTPFSLLS